MTCAWAAKEPERLTDAELIDWFLGREGRDERPFAELFRRHRQLVWRVALGYLGDPRDAEDMTQEVFFSAFRSLREFKGESSFRTWVHRITVNRCKNELRRRSRRPKTIQPPIEEVADAMPDGTPGPEDRSMTQSDLARLARAMSALDPEERRLLQQVEIEQLPYQEVARRLGISTGAVKMRVLRTRRRLQEALEAALQGRDR